MTGAKNIGVGWLMWKSFDGEVDSPLGRVAAGCRLKYLEQEYEATRDSGSAWDAYRQCRKSNLPLPEWVLAFLDGIAQEGDRGEPASPEARLEFEVAARVAGLSTIWFAEARESSEKLGQSSDSDSWQVFAVEAFEVVARDTGRTTSWVKDAFLRHQELVDKPLDLEDGGREFFIGRDWASFGGRKSAVARRDRGLGITLAIANELLRWKGVSDDPPSAKQIWWKLETRYREWTPVGNRWEVRLERAEERISERRTEDERPHSIARATFPRYLAKAKSAVASKKA